MMGYQVSVCRDPIVRYKQIFPTWGRKEDHHF